MRRLPAALLASAVLLAPALVSHAATAKPVFRTTLLAGSSGSAEPLLPASRVVRKEG